MDATFSIIMLSAVLVGGVLVKLSQKNLAIDWQDRLAIGMAAFCGAMFGAKLPFAFYYESDSTNLFAISWLASGKTILTGLVGGYLSVEFVKFSLGIKTKTGDTYAAPVAISIAIGRLACFRAGCCYGIHTDLPWGVVFPEVDQIPRHPTQLYESGFHFLMAIGLYWLQQRQMFSTHLMKLYIIAYACYRLLTEFIRPENKALLGLTAYQWASIAIILIFCWLWHKEAMKDHNQALVA